MLHFADHAAWLDNDGARRLRRHHDGHADKGLDARSYMAKRNSAAARAPELDRRHTRNGTPLPDDNPSSGMHLLIAAVGVPDSIVEGVGGWGSDPGWTGQYGWVTSPSAPVVATGYPWPIETTRLANGLRVVVSEDRSAPVVVRQPLVRRRLAARAAPGRPASRTSSST